MTTTRSYDAHHAAQSISISIRRLTSGYYRLKGRRSCDWSQVPSWPCSEEVLREGAFPGASEAFFQACMEEAMTDLLKEVTP
jgi:hypothetical protein